MNQTPEEQAAVDRVLQAVQAERDRLREALEQAAKEVPLGAWLDDQRTDPPSREWTIPDDTYGALQVALTRLEATS